MPSTPTEPLYRFYDANIHEERWLARLLRALPFLSFVVLFVVVQLLAWYEKTSFLVICAVLNMCMWLWIVSMALYSLKGSYQTSLMIEQELEAEESDEIAKMKASNAPLHVVVIPNYKEGEKMMAQTLQCLSECIGAKQLWVVLAMEAREGEAGKEKAKNLCDDFRSHFAEMLQTSHPADMQQEHLDGSSHPEVPGKASNMRWAIRFVHDTVAEKGAGLDSTVVTVADSDVLFHPSYFYKVSVDYGVVKAQKGGIENWTMWQAPQLPYRNYYASPAPSRVWGYVYTVYEFGGVAGLSAGGHHMLFSAYSVPLQLAMMCNPLLMPAHDGNALEAGDVNLPQGSKGRLWDGDVVAEDHHAYLKAWFYSVWHSASLLQIADNNGQGCRPKLRVRPVMLPTKATSVESDTYWQSLKDRWAQAVRHCTGVAEIPYSLLVCWYMIGTLPRNCYNFKFVWQNMVVAGRLWLMEMVPIWHFIAFTKLTVYWLFHDQSLPQCPDRIWAVTNERFLLCGLAGAWALTWPVIIPFFLAMLSSFCFLMVVFVRPKLLVQERKDTIMKEWYKADSGTPPTCGSTALTILLQITFDAIFVVSPVMLVYGIFAMIVGSWNVMRRGNQINYISASKGLTSDSGEGYGSCEPAGRSAADAVNTGRDIPKEANQINYISAS